MLTGTADAERLAERPATATIEAWEPGDVVLEGVTSLQLIVELRRAEREALLPPGLDPTDPPSLHVQWWQVGASPWGPFSWAVTRMSCRSGARARALTTAAVASTQEAATGLAGRFGYPCTEGDVGLAVHYDGCLGRVSADGQVTLEVSALDPTPLAPDAVQVTSTMNLARTPLGLRLVQVEAHPRTSRVERVDATLRRFEASRWGDDRLDPYHLVSAVVVRDDAITLPAVRFVCQPDVDAFAGTERIDTTGGS